MMIKHFGLAVWVRLCLMGVMLPGLLPGLPVRSPVEQTRLTIYLPQPGIPTAIPNFVNPGAGCAWWGVGGQVFNEAGRPEAGLVVRVRGTVEGRSVNLSAVSGGSLGFGAGGFDLQLSDHIPSSASLTLQLFDTAGRARSAQNPLPVLASCGQNLVVLNLRQRSYNLQYFLPVIRK